MHEWITEWYLLVTAECSQGEEIVGLDTREILPMVTVVAVGALGIFALFQGVKLVKRALKSSAGPVEYGEDYWESRGPGRDMDFAMARGEFPAEMLEAEERGLWEDYGEGEYPEGGIESIAGTDEYEAFFERLDEAGAEHEPFDPDKSREWLEEQGFSEEDVPF